MKKLTNKEFIKRLQKANPSINSLEKYVNTSTKILVEDKLHIKYRVLPSELLKGTVPTILSAVNKNKCFIIKANKVHNDYYNYSKVQYVKGYFKVLIICPVHGEFLQSPAQHLQGQGCKKCGTIKATSPNKMTLTQFIEKAHKKHNNKYIYDNVIYKGCFNKINITCPIHGIFTQTPGSHLYGRGCTKCNKRTTVHTFEDRANKIHNFKYIYKDLNFKDSNSKIKIVCPTHGEFIQVVYTHLLGHGCPNCGKESNPMWSKTDWVNFCNKKINADPKIYIIRCFNNNENFIKIGITSNSVHKRFYNKLFPYSYEVLKELKGSSDFVFDKEKELHKLCKKYSYKPYKSFGGETECFTTNCLSLLPL